MEADSLGIRANLLPNSPWSPSLTYAWLPGISRVSKNVVAVDLDLSNETFKMASSSSE
jgi:hypothetical protein